MRVALVGPMKGLPDFNFPAFDHAANALRVAGHTVFSPADRAREALGYHCRPGANPDGDEAELAARVGKSELDLRREVLAGDTKWICKHADAIALLPGWGSSSGARAEKALADAIGLEVIRL